MRLRRTGRDEGGIGVHDDRPARSQRHDDPGLQGEDREPGVRPHRGALADPETLAQHGILETPDPLAATQITAALARAGRRTALALPARALDPAARALRAAAPDLEPTLVRPGDGPIPDAALLLLDERVLFDALGARELGVELLPPLDHLVLGAADGLLDRARRALTVTSANARAVGFLDERLSLAPSPGAVALVPDDLRDHPALMAMPVPYRMADRALYLERTRKGRVLRSSPVALAPILDDLARTTPITAVGRALAVGDLTFAARDLGLPGLTWQDPASIRDDLLLFRPELPPATDRDWPARVPGAVRDILGLAAGEVTVLASAWNHQDLRHAVRAEATFVRSPEDLGRPDVLVLDRLSFGSPLPAVDLLERRSPRAFLDLALPRAVQRFRWVASHVAPHGTLVVLDGRIRASWAAPFGDTLPSFHTSSWDVFRTWANPLHAVGGLL